MLYLSIVSIEMLSSNHDWWYQFSNLFNITSSKTCSSILLVGLVNLFKLEFINNEIYVPDIKEIPIVNVKDKLLGGYSVSDIIEPMLFNNSVPDRAGELNLRDIPTLRMETPVYKSHAGAVLMGIICVLALLLSPLTPIAIAIGLPVLTVKKRKKAKKHQEPFYRYS